MVSIAARQLDFWEGKALIWDVSSYVFKINQKYGKLCEIKMKLHLVSL